METQKSNQPLSTRLLRLAFILLFIDFIPYKLFAEPIGLYHSFGWYIFLVTSIFCGASFIAGLIALLQEYRISKGKSHGKNGSSSSPKREKIKKQMVRLMIFGFPILVYNTVLLLKFGNDAKLYPQWAAKSFFICQTALLVILIVGGFLLTKYFATLKNEKKN
jgi:ABC-type transport system involved in cytochrome c biogenesis permease subunit